jgi:hypothetical protein
MVSAQEPDRLKAKRSSIAVRAGVSGGQKPLSLG